MRQRKERAVFGPGDFAAYLASRRGRPRSEIRVPEDAVFTYDHATYMEAIAETKAAPVDWYAYPGRLYLGDLGRRQVGIVHALVGAPVATMNLEELVAYGARRIYEVGLSGAIDPKLSAGDVVVLRGAYSDEGTSKRYFTGGRWFASSRELTKNLAQSLRACKVEYSMGDAWTTDAPYRETRRMVVRYRGMGAKVVNMESSALFALSRYRRVDVASAQIVSDLVLEKGWSASFHNTVIGGRRKAVLAAVLNSIRG